MEESGERVGGPLTARDITQIILKSDSSVLFLDNWEAFSRSLGLKEIKILEWRKKLIRELLELQDVPNEIVQHWIAIKGSQGSLEDFCSALDEIGALDISESIKIAYNQKIEISDIQNVAFSCHGKLLTLKKLVGEIYLEEICESIRSGLKKCFLPCKPIKIFQEHVISSKIPNYYVPRRLQHNDSNELQASIFLNDSTHDHVFLFRGITRSDLVKLTKYQAVEQSGNQLEKATVTFILLECDDDCDRICTITNKSVHLIQYADGRCFWVKSSGGLEIIRRFLKYQVNIISEDETARRMVSCSGPTSFSIADLPGMGKTLFLDSLAQRIREYDSTSVVLFISLRQFLRCYVKMENSTFSVIETIASYTTSNRVAELAITELLKRNICKFYLLLDGYDEVSLDNLDLVDSFLAAAQTIPSIKLIVTTRTHLQTRLENIFYQFSYEILPFTKQDQAVFLNKYWIKECGIEKSPALHEFIKNCLQHLALQSASFRLQEKDITGIPLQCWMFGVVYAKYAQRVSKLETLPKNQIHQYSFFEMHKKLIAMKFEIFSKLTPECSLKVIFNAHAYHSIILLFPQHAATFKSLRNFNQLDEDQLFSIGILVKKSFQTNFIHHTFAEYFLAEFIVKNLKKVSVVNIFFGEIFGRKGHTTEKSSCHDHPQLKLKYTTLAYFIDNHLREFSNVRPIKMFRNIFSINFKPEDVCAAVASSCSHNFEHTFDYTSKFLATIGINKKLKKKYFRNLLHVAVENLNDVSVLKNVMEFTKYELKLDLRFHVIGFKRNLPGYLYVPQFTPLHQAIRCGKYNFASFLLNEYGFGIYRLNELLHTCVFDSAGDSDSVIEDKQLIIDMLVQTNPYLLEEENLNKCTPLLQYNVHFTLLKHLVKWGADINAYSPWEGTIIHMVANKHTYMDVVDWAYQNGFFLSRATNFLGTTPRQHIYKTFGNEGLEKYNQIRDRYIRPGNVVVQSGRTQQMDNSENAIPNAAGMSKYVTIQEVVDEIKDAAVLYLIIENWRLVCEKLEIQDHTVAFLQRFLIVNTMEPSELPRQILRAWLAEKVQNATIGRLCDAMIECRMFVLAERLRTRFDQRAKLIASSFPTYK